MSDKKSSITRLNKRKKVNGKKILNLNFEKLEIILN